MSETTPDYPTYPKEVYDLALYSQLDQVIHNTLEETTSSVVASTGSGKTVSLCVGLYVALAAQRVAHESGHFESLKPSSVARVLMSFPTCLAVDKMDRYVHHLLAPLHAKT